MYNAEDLEGLLLSWGPDDDNLDKWNIVLIGPEETIYEECLIPITITYYSSNVDVYLDPILFHPNVNPKTGRLCYSAEKEGESVMKNPIILSLGVLELIRKPNWESPEFDVAISLHDNEEVFDKFAKRLVKLSLDPDRGASVEECYKWLAETQLDFDASELGSLCSEVSADDDRLAKKVRRALRRYKDEYEEDTDTDASDDEEGYYHFSAY